MALVYIRPLGANLAFVHAIEPVDPGYGGGRPGGVDPGFDIPAWLRPGHALPGGGHIDNSLPGAPGHPDNRPPSGPPPQVGPGEVLVLVRDQAGVWHYASLPSGSPPPKPVPVPPPGTVTPPIAETPAPKK